MAYCQARKEAQGRGVFVVISGQNDGLSMVFGDFVGDIW